jgi:hypothetical protein
MNISKSIGKITGKVVDMTKSAPSATTSKFSHIKRELAEGYREVVPAKDKK